MTDNFDTYHAGDDDFKVRTFDSGRLNRPPDDPGPDEAADYDPGDDRRDDFNESDDLDVVEDDFTAYTVEPRITRRASTPAPAIPLRHPSYRRERARRRAQPKTGAVWFSTLRSVIVVILAAVLVSTIFSLWTRPTFFSEEFRAGLNRVQATQHLFSIQPSPLPTDVREVRIGIIAGHSGPPQDTSFEVDPGAVCDDGLTELSINEAVAQKAVSILQGDGYTVELFQEFDPRLTGYEGDVLVSIHTNDCGDYGDAGAGFNAASASARQTTRGADERLLDCLINQYGATTGLPRHFGLTFDMTEYHNFDEVAVDTPTAIIELGFMRIDRLILTQQPDLLALGVANGVRCFLSSQ